MKRYRDEALKHPLANRLYLEDLSISIPMFEAAVKNSTVVVQKGFVDIE